MELDYVVKYVAPRYLLGRSSAGNMWRCYDITANRTPEVYCTGSTSYVPNIEPDDIEV